MISTLQYEFAEEAGAISRIWLARRRSLLLWGLMRRSRWDQGERLRSLAEKSLFFRFFGEMTKKLSPDFTCKPEVKDVFVMGHPDYCSTTMVPLEFWNEAWSPKNPCRTSGYRESKSKRFARFVRPS